MGHSYGHILLRAPAPSIVEWSSKPLTMLKVLEAAIGIEPMNKGFAVLKSGFHLVSHTTSERVSNCSFGGEPTPEYV